MISAEIIGNIPDIQEMKYKSGKIISMGLWIIGIFIFAMFWK